MRNEGSESDFFFLPANGIYTFINTYRFDLLCNNSNFLDNSFVTFFVLFCFFVLMLFDKSYCRDFEMFSFNSHSLLFFYFL
jgi:hypothetical protein